LDLPELFGALHIFKIDYSHDRFGIVDLVCVLRYECFKALRITIAVLVSDLATGISLKNGDLFTIYLSRRELVNKKLSGPEAT
jgi:hypothetical protein